MAQLPAYLADIQREIEHFGREYGLDFWDCEFEILDYKKMQEVAAFGGFPVATRTGASGWSSSTSPRATSTASRRSTRW